MRASMPCRIKRGSNTCPHQHTLHLYTTSTMLRAICLLLMLVLIHEINREPRIDLAVVWIVPIGGRIAEDIYIGIHGQVAT